MENNKLIITPKTKVLQLIEAYPQLEELLISRIPAFSKLKNPLLRKTVAKVATLQQAALIGNIRVHELVNILRKEVGQDSIDISEHQGYTIERPTWFDENMIIGRLDIAKMLNDGEQPVNMVMAEIKNVETGQIFEVIAPFIPAPLIDKAASIGFDHWVSKSNADTFSVYFFKK